MRALSQPLLSRASTWRSRGTGATAAVGCPVPGDHAAGHSGASMLGGRPLAVEHPPPATRSTVLAP